MVSRGTCILLPEQFKSWVYTYFTLLCIARRDGQHTLVVTNACRSWLTVQRVPVDTHSWLEQRTLQEKTGPHPNPQQHPVCDRHSCRQPTMPHSRQKALGRHAAVITCCCCCCAGATSHIQQRQQVIQVTVIVIPCCCGWRWRCWCCCYCWLQPRHRRLSLLPCCWLVCCCCSCRCGLRC